MDYELTTMQASEFIGVSDRRIRQLAEDGIITRQENDKFSAKVIAEQYYRFKYDVGDSAEYEKQKSKHEALKVKLTEIKLARMENKVLDADIVERVMTGHIVTCRTRLLAIPHKLAPQIIGIKEISKIYELIDNEIRLALEELSEFDPAIFADDVETGD